MKTRFRAPNKSPLCDSPQSILLRWPRWRFAAEDLCLLLPSPSGFDANPNIYVNCHRIASVAESKK